MTTALTLSGSIRTGSYNRMLQQEVGKALLAVGIVVTAIDLGDYPMPIFNEDLEAENTPEAAARLAEQMRAHEIIFIASPEYNGGMTPLLVNTLAWLSRQKPNPFRHAVIGIGGVSSGKYGTIWSLSHLRDSLTKIGGLVVPGLLGIGPSEDTFVDGVLTDAPSRRKLEQMIHDLTHIKRG